MDERLGVRLEQVDADVAADADESGVSADGDLLDRGNFVGLDEDVTVAVDLGAVDIGADVILNVVVRSRPANADLAPTG
jgi:hypothetical protein